MNASIVKLECSTEQKPILFNYDLELTQETNRSLPVPSPSIHVAENTAAKVPNDVQISVLKKRGRKPRTHFQIAPHPPKTEGIKTAAVSPLFLDSTLLQISAKPTCSNWEASTPAVNINPRAELTPVGSNNDAEVVKKGAGGKRPGAGRKPKEKPPLEPNHRRNRPSKSVKQEIDKKLTEESLNLQILGPSQPIQTSATTSCDSKFTKSAATVIDEKPLSLPAVKSPISPDQKCEENVVKFSPNSLPDLADLATIGRIVDAQDFDWDKFMEERAGCQAINGNLFMHERFLEHTLGEHVLEPGRLVRVRLSTENENSGSNCPSSSTEKLTKPEFALARIRMVFGDQLMVDFLEENKEAAGQDWLSGGRSWVDNCVPTGKSDFVQLEQIETFERLYSGDSAFNERETKIQNIFYTRRHLLTQKLVNFIQVNQFFELQARGSGPLDGANPSAVLNVETVKISGVHNGMVLVDHLDGSKELVHITSDRCHPLGWAKAQNERDGAKYSLKSAVDLPNAAGGEEMAAPLWLFEFRPLKEHKFEVAGNAPGNVGPGEPDALCSRLCCRSAQPPLFPRPSDQRRQLARRIVGTADSCLPSKLFRHFPDRLVRKNGSPIYSTNRYGRGGLLLLGPPVPSQKTPFPGQISSMGFAPDSFFDLPKLQVKRLERMRFCEVQHPLNPFLFIPAVIVRSYKYLVWVHLEAEERFTLPRIYNIRSTELFRCGFASRAGMKVLENPTRLSALIKRFDLSTAFTAQRTFVFRENKKKFLSAMWLNSDLWLPAIALNTSCFCGPFLNREKLRTLNPRYGPAPLPLVINALVKDLLSCAVRLRELIELISADKLSKMPQIQVKFKQSNRRHRVNIETCENVGEFPGWLRVLLAELDACPQLFTCEIQQRIQCTFNCEQVADVPYVKAEGHVNTMSITASTQQSNRIAYETQQFKRRNQQQKLKQLKLQEQREAIKNKVAGEVEGQSKCQDVPGTFAAAATVAKTRAKRVVTRKAAETKAEGVKINSAVSEESSRSEESPPLLHAQHNMQQKSPKKRPPVAQPMATMSGDNEGEENKVAKKPRLSITTNLPVSAAFNPLAQVNLDDFSSSSICSSSSDAESSNDGIAGIGAKVGSAHDDQPVRNESSSSSAADNAMARGRGDSSGPPQLSRERANPSPNATHAQPPLQFYGVHLGSHSILAQQQRATSSLAAASFANFHGPGPGASNFFNASSQLGGCNAPRVRQKCPPIESNPRFWSCEHLAGWVRSAGCGYAAIAQRLLDEEVDGEGILLFDLNTLKLQMSLKLGPAVKVMALVEELKLAAEAGDSQNFGGQAAGSSNRSLSM